MQTFEEYQQWLETQVTALDRAYNNSLGFDPTDFLTPADCWEIVNEAGWNANRLGWSTLALECFDFADCGDYRPVSVMLGKCIAKCRSESLVPVGVASPAQSLTQADAQPEAPKQQIDRWSQVGIGVHADCRGTNGRLQFIAYFPCPEIEAKVTLSMGAAFELRQSQLSKLLLLLAGSDDGKTVEKSKVIDEYGYAVVGAVRREVDERGNDLRSFDSHDSASQVTPEQRLTGAIRTNSRDFREKAPMIAHDLRVFSADHPTRVISQVLVRPMIRREIPGEHSFYTFGGSIDLS